MRFFLYLLLLFPIEITHATKINQNEQNQKIKKTPKIKKGARIKISIKTPYMHIVSYGIAKADTTGEEDDEQLPFEVNNKKIIYATPTGINQAEVVL